MKQHLCKGRPGFKEGRDDPWVEGPVIACPYHGHSGAKQLGYRESRADRRKADREAGVVGIDRGTHITGMGKYVTEE